MQKVLSQEKPTQVHRIFLYSVTHNKMEFKEYTSDYIQDLNFRLQIEASLQLWWLRLEFKFPANIKIAFSQMLAIRS